MGLASYLEWSGSLVGLLGAALLAAGGPNAGRGFVAFLLSNFCWIGFGFLQGATGLVVMQVGFTVTSIVGIRKGLSWCRSGTQLSPVVGLERPTKTSTLFARVAAAR